MKVKNNSDWAISSQLLNVEGGSETIRNWSKLQVQLKRQGISISYNRFGKLLKLLKETNDMQDIVQSLEKSKAGVITA